MRLRPPSSSSCLRLAPPIVAPARGRFAAPPLPSRCPFWSVGLGCRAFRASPSWRRDEVARANHYERLGIRHDATPAEIKKSFYTLSKTHHPDANPTDPTASSTFSLLSESYTILSDPSRRAAYDRDVLRLHEQHGSHHRPHGSYHSSHPAGGRSPSGLSRRRGQFRGPPPSFYRSGGWGAQGEKRRRAHEESTGAGGSGSSGSGPWNSQYGGMGPGEDPFGHRDDVPHFDKEAHLRTHQRQDRRRWDRERRAMNDDDVEFEPQTSLGAHFLVVVGILAATVMVPAVYLQVVRAGKSKKDDGRGSVTDGSN